MLLALPHLKVKRWVMLAQLSQVHLVLQQRKKKLATELIGEEEGFVKGLTEDDIEFLFS